MLSELSESEITNSNSKQLQASNPFKEANIQVNEKLSHQKQCEHLTLVKTFNTMKLQLINYFTGIGKLKALVKIHHCAKNNPDNIKGMFSQQISKLQLKLETVDIKITELVQHRMVRKGVKQEYFRCLGQSAVVKCSIKGLDFNHIYDYLALNLIKLRTYESMWMAE